jgi:hypothetical protein
MARIARERGGVTALLNGSSAVAVALLACTAAARGASESNCRPLRSSRATPVEATTEIGDEVLREARSRRYDIPVLGPLASTSTGERPLLYEPSVEPALPLESDLIVIGRVEAERAYLTASGSLIYTEYDVNIDSVLHRGGAADHVGDRIVVSRLGGAIRLGSGRILQVWVPERFFPTVGRRYLCFLRANPGAGDFSIIRSYELVCGRAYSMDLLFDPVPSTFDGASEAEVVLALRTELEKRRR